MIAFVERVEAKQFFNKKQPLKKDKHVNNASILKIESDKKEKKKEKEKEQNQEKKRLTEEELLKGIFKIIFHPP